MPRPCALEASSVQATCTHMLLSHALSPLRITQEAIYRTSQPIVPFDTLLEQAVELCKTLRDLCTIELDTFAPVKSSLTYSLIRSPATNTSFSVRYAQSRPPRRQAHIVTIFRHLLPLQAAYNTCMYRLESRGLQRNEPT